MVVAQLGHEIYDARADIRDLDVGDIDDMDIDVPATFTEWRKRRSQPARKFEMPTNPADLMAMSSSGTAMSFVLLDMDWVEKNGKEGADRLAASWRSLLETGSVSCTVYVISAGQLLIVTTDGSHWGKVREFVLSQPETDWFEKDNNKIFPPGRTAPKCDMEERKKREDEAGLAMGLNDPPPEKRVFKPTEPPKKKKKNKKAKRAPEDDGKSEL